MQKLGTWVVALFIAAVCGLLSASAFQGWDHSGSSNRIINMLIALEHFLVGAIGGIATGVVFALAALGVLYAAWTHEPEAK
jgi:hypothetical protein